MIPGTAQQILFAEQQSFQESTSSTNPKGRHSENKQPAHVARMPSSVERERAQPESSLTPPPSCLASLKTQGTCSTRSAACHVRNITSIRHLSDSRRAKGGIHKHTYLRRQHMTQEQGMSCSSWRVGGELCLLGRGNRQKQQFAET